MKGARKIAKMTKDINVKDKSTWISLYYDCKNKMLTTEPGGNSYYITELINPCTEKDVEEAYYHCEI